MLSIAMVICSNAQAIHWNDEATVSWAHGCDFQGNDIRREATPAHLCGPACENFASCTHFTWSEFNSGTCWLKSSSTVTKADAFVSNQANVVCGIVRRESTAPKKEVEQCPKKKVKIYKFCIDGDDDAGAHGEHQLRLDGRRYYPQSSCDCRQRPNGYCKWREGQCHNLGSAQAWAVHSAKSLTVGTEEYDTWSENDSYVAHLGSAEWHNPTCETYEVRIAKPFKSEVQKSVCWEASASVTAKMGEVGGSVTSCSEWTQPAESYVWFMTVEPDRL